MVRFGLVRSERDAIVINLDHTAGDGASARLLAYLLASAYSHPERMPACDAAEVFAKRHLDALWPFLRENGKRLRAKMPRRNRAPSWQFAWGEAAQYSKRLVIRRIEGSRADAVNQFAAARGAWPNDLFLAAYFRALGGATEDASAVPRLTVPVDMRGYLSARHRPRIANMASAFEVELNDGLGESFDDTLRRVRAATEAQRNGRPGLAEAAFLSSFINRVPQRLMQKRFESGKIKMDAFAPWFIALGVLRPERLSFGRTSACRAYSLQSFGRAGAMFQIGVSSFRDSITVAVCFAGDPAQEARVNSILDRFVSELPS